MRNPKPHEELSTCESCGKEKGAWRQLDSIEGYFLGSKCYNKIIAQEIIRCRTSIKIEKKYGLPSVKEFLTMPEERRQQILSYICESVRMSSGEEKTMLIEILEGLEALAEEQRQGKEQLLAA